MTRILVPYHLDEHLPDLDVPIPADVTIAETLPAGDTWRRMSHLYGSVAAAVAADVMQGRQPLVMSGDCTTSLGVVAGMQTAWYLTGDERWLRLTKLFGKLFLINFAMGVVTGIVQEFQFGMNWSEYSRFVGDVFGAPLALEGLAAFAEKRAPNFKGR